MAKRHKKSLIKRIIIITIAAVSVFTAAFAVGYLQGVFLPGWINWKNTALPMDNNSLIAEVNDRQVIVRRSDTIGDNSGKGVTDANGVSGTAGAGDGKNAAGGIVWELPGKCKTQNVLVGDIDGDRRDELLVLCWRIGRYGKRRPFWVKKDEITWSQHIYIYDVERGSVKAKWMASDIGILVNDWEIEDGRFVVTYSPKGEKNTWAWISWGLERIPEEWEDTSLNGEYLRRLRNEYRDESENGQDNVGAVSDDSETGSGEMTDKKCSTDNSEDDSTDRNYDGSDTNPDNTEKTSNANIIMVGDILLHTGVAESCKREDGTYDFQPLFENTEDYINAADLAIVNQEVIIGGAELGVTGYPSFNAPYELGDALTDAGFDVICHATNHALDKGKKGLINCLDYWENNHPDIDVVGIYASEEDSGDVCIADANGIRVAVLNYTYGTNGIPLPSDMPFAVNLLNDKERIAKNLEYAEENADFTIVCPHWGIEYQLDYNREQQTWAEFFVENGADLIIATHPHVIEPVKWVEADNGNRGLCYYSLGNFINWTSGRGSSVGNRMVGAIADVSIEMGNDKNVVITDYDAIPIVSHVEHRRGSVTTYLMEDYTEELAQANAIREQGSQFSLEYCKELWERVMGSPSDLTKQALP